MGYFLIQMKAILVVYVGGWGGQSDGKHETNAASYAYGDGSVRYDDPCPLTKPPDLRVKLSC